ncbi:MAG: PKD domain-containing protein [Bacteroidales bacterium]|nr:PKD domain-containing protein [Bacteroidales bacterium]
MRTFTLLLLLSLIASPFLVSFSQTPEAKAPARAAFNMNHNNNLPEADGIVAAFSADVRSGYAPLTVSFTDQSTGEVQSWNWSFGDGQTSDEQNPGHTYTEPGLYSVSLTVADSVSHYTLEKEEYIRVNAEPGACDTLDFPFSGTYTYYPLQSPQKGYVSGTNSYGDRAKANVFEPGYSSLVSGVFVDFAIAEDISGTNPDVEIAIWNDAGTNGTPGSIIASRDIPLSTIIDDVADDVATWVEFFEPVSVSNKFYIGVVLPTTSDTLALWTDTSPESPANKGWEQWENQTWHAYSSDQSWGLMISNAIHPVVCQVNSTRTNFPEGSIAVYPVPARDRLYVSVTDQVNHIQSIELYDMHGRLCYSNSFDGNATVRVVPLDFPAGIYMIRAIAADYVLSQKILISE